MLLMAIAKSKANLISIAIKSEKSDNYKSDIYGESNQEKKQRRLRKICREKLKKIDNFYQN